MKHFAAMVFAVSGLCLFLPGAASAAALVPLADSTEWKSEPIFVTAPPNDSRVFVVERGSSNDPGAIRVVEGGNLKPRPFLTIEDINVQSERGVLSMAFAPDYATSGLFYVFYTAGAPNAGDVRISEFRRSVSNPDLADPDYERIVLTTPHSAGNHNGGWIAFGPDDKLYVTIGDNANRANAQNRENLFGKVLRIDPADPDGAGPLTATIPSDNPFVGTAEDRGEIYAYGLRNPFRASFAPDGDLTIGDVGDGTTEEIDAGVLKGKNMGWPTCEGFCTTPQPGLTDPVFDYPSDNNPDCAVAGGNVVRDPQLTGLLGRYIYGDFCADDLRTLNLEVAGADPGSAALSVGGPKGGLRAFGEDSRGCIYVATTATVYRIAPTGTSGKDCPRDVAPPPPPDPDPLPPATYSAYIPNPRTIGRRLITAGRCSVTCTIRASATIRISRNRFRKRPGRVRVKPVTYYADGNVRTRLTMRIPLRVVKRIRFAMRRGSRVFAFTRVSLEGSDGSAGAASGSTRLLLPPRR